MKRNLHIYFSISIFISLIFLSTSVALNILSFHVLLPDFESFMSLFVSEYGLAVCIHFAKWEGILSLVSAKHYLRETT